MSPSFDVVFEENPTRTGQSYLSGWTNSSGENSCDGWTGETLAADFTLDQLAKRQLKSV